MKLRHIPENQYMQNAHLVEITDNITILFSYETPVALVGVVDSTFKVYKTDRKWSSTTSKHINAWFRNLGVSDAVEEKPQKFFDDIRASISFAF